MFDLKLNTVKISRRTFLRAAGIASAAGLVTACAPPVPAPSSQTSSANEAKPTSAPAAATGNSKVTWFMNIDETRNNWAKNSIRPNFEKENANIKLELLTVPWEEHDKKLFALNAAGTPADVFAQWGQSGGGTYYHKGLLLEITEMAKAANWDLTKVPEILQKAYSFEGKMFGVPMYSLGSFMYYNKKMFEDAGVPLPPTDWEDPNWTWDEMIVRAKKLTKNPDDPTKAQYGLQIALPDLYGGVPWLFGADPFDEAAYKAGRAESVKMNTPGMIEAVQARVDLIHKHKVSPSPVQNEAIASAGNVLATGKVAMVINGGWGIWDLAGLKDLQWGIASMPKAKTNTIPTFSDPWYIGKGTKVADAAFTLVRYLTTGAGQRSIALDLAAPPADQTLLKDWYAKFPTVSAKELEQCYTGAGKHWKETPASLIYGYIQVEDVYNQIMTAVLNNERPVADALGEIDQKANAELKKI